jgi:hypothetical protein
MEEKGFDTVLIRFWAENEFRDEIEETSLTPLLFARKKQVVKKGGTLLLSRRIKTVSKTHLKHPLGLSVERRADSPGCWKD